MNYPVTVIIFLKLKQKQTTKPKKTTEFAQFFIQEEGGNLGSHLPPPTYSSKNQKDFVSNFAFLSIKLSTLELSESRDFVGHIPMPPLHGNITFATFVPKYH